MTFSAPSLHRREISQPSMLKYVQPEIITGWFIGLLFALVVELVTTYYADVCYFKITSVCDCVAVVFIYF